MTLLGTLVHLLARIFTSVGYLFHRLGNLFHALLPVMFSPRQLTDLLNKYYVHSYYSPNNIEAQTLDPRAFELDAWEADVCNRYGIDSGRILVLGCGWGREAIAIARRKVGVVGVDLNHDVLKVPRRIAKTHGYLADFHQASFLSLPYTPASFNFAIFSGTMYSAIPTRRGRQVLLNDLGRLVKPDGPIILSYQIQHQSASRLDRLSARLNAWLLQLPGANHQYQLGDVCLGSHFFHLFQDETELQRELEGAGATIRELNWMGQYAVVTYLPRMQQTQAASLGQRKTPDP